MGNTNQSLWQRLNSFIYMLVLYVYVCYLNLLQAKIVFLMAKFLEMLTTNRITFFMTKRIEMLTMDKIIEVFTMDKIIEVFNMNKIIEVFTMD